MPTDAELDAIADRYRHAMRRASRGSLTEFSLTPYDRTGVPVHATVWDDGTHDAHGVGYGRTTPQATVGALGELAERVLMDAVLAPLPVRRASRRELVAELGARHVADPVALVIDAGVEYDDDRPLTWWPAIRWRTGESVLVPAEFVAHDGPSLPPGRPDGLITPITNGMGAGDSRERAVSHGLLELVQRDGDNVVFRALDAGRVIDLSSIGDPDVLDVLKTLRGAGIEPLVKLASTEFACVTYCVGEDQDDTAPIALSAIGEAAHPDRDVSVAKALLEFASSRARRIFAFGDLDRVERLSPDYLRAELGRSLGGQEPRALEAMRRWTTYDLDRMAEVLAPIFTARETVEYDTLPRSPHCAAGELLDLMLDRLRDFDVLVVAGERDGMHVAKVLAPGLEVESMSYLRLGERAVRQLLDTDLVGIGRPTAPSRLALVLTTQAVERLGGPAWVDRDAVTRTVGELYPLYREPRRHAVQRT